MAATNGAWRRALALGALVFALSACVSSTGRNPSGLKTLAFELPDLSGKTVSTREFEGQVVLVDFWATWCRPCEQSMPFYASLQERLGGRGFKVLAISVDARDEDVARYVERRHLPFAVLRDPKGEVAKEIDSAMETMPTAVLIGRDGRVRRVHGGFVPGDAEVLEREVLALLDETPPVSASDASAGPP